MKRPEDETLRLVVRLVNHILTSPAIGVGFKLEVAYHHEQGLKVSITEPEAHALRDLVSEARKFDVPSEDAYLPRVFDILDRRTFDDGEWRTSLDAAKADYQVAQNDIGPMRVMDVDDPESFVRPREAFELWVYGDHLHNDYAKEQRFERFGPLAQPMLREMGHNYLTLLISEAEFLARLISRGLAPPLDPPPPPMTYPDMDDDTSASP